MKKARKFDDRAEAGYDRAAQTARVRPIAELRRITATGGKQLAAFCGRLNVEEYLALDGPPPRRKRQS